MVDEAWQFTCQWLLGTDAMTTNNGQGMFALPRPSQAITYGTYLLAWGSG